MRSIMIVQKFKQLYKELNGSNVDIIESVYAPNISFEDPFHQIEGLINMKQYFHELYENVEAISFDFGESISDGNSHYVNWVMNLTHPKLNKGRPFDVPGVTFIKGNDAQEIIMHRDYFDAGVMLYEKIPVLGSLVKYVKSKL
jgi:hypothetical protein